MTGHPKIIVFLFCRPFRYLGCLIQSVNRITISSIGQARPVELDGFRGVHSEFYLYYHVLSGTDETWYS